MAINNISTYHIRSISFPSRLHKTSTRIDEELTRFKTREEQQLISHGISGLIDLYKCLNDLLNSPTANKEVFKAGNIGRLGFLLDGSVKILDVCGITRDLVGQTKENLIDLQSCLRRRKGDLGIETSIAKFTSLRKSIAKKAKKLALSTLKQDQENDQETEHLVNVLNQVNSASFRVLESLLAFLGKSKSRSLVAKWMQKGCQEKGNSNEMERVDEALYRACKGGCEGEKMVVVMASLKCLESAIEEMENGLEGLFRQLIKARGSLLNIVSQ